MYLFDTDVLTTVLKPRPPRRLLERLSDVPASRQFTSTVTISEIVYGAHKSDRTDHHIRNLEQVLLPAVNVLDFDAEAAYLAGAIRARLEARGLPLSFADIQIAAIARANELTLITGNERNFRRIGDLRVESWLA
ncbi:MAG: PIN domain-containing protein [Polyangia bacterium]